MAKPVSQKKKTSPIELEKKDDQYRLKFSIPLSYQFPVVIGLIIAFLVLFLIPLKIYLALHKVYIPKVVPPPVPQGEIKTDKLGVPVNGSVTFEAKKLLPTEGKIAYVRYYILNPSLAEGNAWGDPSYCSCGVCEQEDNCSIKTYDLGESSDETNNYKIVWNYATTLGSAALVRGLTPGNILPGRYKIMLQVVDTQGNINLSASEVELTLEPPNKDLPQVTFVNCPSEIFGTGYTFSWTSQSEAVFAYKLDNGSFEDLEEKTWVTLELGQGNHTLTVRAVGHEGLESGETCRFKAESY